VEPLKTGKPLERRTFLFWKHYGEVSIIAAQGEGVIVIPNFAFL
jgi:hypothetical protein